MRALTPSKTAVVKVLSSARLVSAVVSCSDLRNLRAAPKCDFASKRGFITASRQALGYRSSQIQNSRSTICSAAAQHEMVTLLPDIIPLKILFGNPEKTAPQISPDGKLLAYLAPSEKDVLNVWIRSVATDDARMVTNDTVRGIRSYQWAEDSTAILYQQDIGGDENFHIWSQPIGGSTPARDLTPFDGVRAQNMMTDKHFPGEILVGLNKRNPQLFDMYRIQIHGDGEPTLDTENPGDVVGWLTDAKFQIRGASSMDPADGSTTLRTRASTVAEWLPIIRWPQEETGGPVAFTQDGESLYVQSSLGSDTARLVRVSAADGSEQETLASDPRCDVGRVMISDTDRVVQAVSFNYLRREWTILDPAVGADFMLVGEIEDGEWSVASATTDERVWVVTFSRDNGPARNYIFNRDTKAHEFLFSNQPALSNYAMSSMDGVVITARDGLQLPAYLSLPVLPEGQEPGKLPLVLNVHGGPWARDFWGYRPDTQWFTNRGYACLQVNFRGSTGFGKGFLHAGDKEWGVGKMQLCRTLPYSGVVLWDPASAISPPIQHDLTDAVQWAIDQGIADPEKIAIYGGSYGGYAVLAGLCFTPELYCCGVDVVGPSHVLTLFQSIPPYWAPIKKQLIDRVGDVEADDEVNRRISPLYHVDKITKPLVIGQGANDPRVKQAEADQIFVAMRKKDLDVKYYLYPDEGHGFARPSNRLDFYSRTEQFLAEHLGGRAEPLLSVPDSSIQVIEHLEPEPAVLNT